jgi:cell division protein FtsZ
VPAPLAGEPDASADGPETGEDEGDELLLGNDDILTSPVGAPPIAPPEDEDETDQPQAAAAGGTLFERMSNIARGAPKAQLDEDESTYRSEPIDIPRFLNRQNNQ